MKRARSGSRTILLYCIMSLWRYLPIKLSGVLVLAPRWCEANRCFIDRRFMISGSEKTFRQDKMCCTLLWWETYGNQRLWECRYNKRFSVWWNVTGSYLLRCDCRLMNGIRDTAEQGSVFSTAVPFVYIAAVFW